MRVPSWREMVVPRRGGRVPSRDRAVEAIRVVASAFGLTVAALRADGNQRATWARQVAIYLATTEGRLTYAEAADLFQRHRQTIWGSVRRVRSIVAEHERVAAQVEELAAKVRRR